MPVTPHRSMIAAFYLASTCLSGAVLAQESPDLTVQAAEAHAAKVRAARSSREAGPSLLALRTGGAVGMKQLSLLLDSEALAPEVSYQTLMQALLSTAPGAADLAVRYISDKDFDIRLAALRQMANLAEAKHADRLLAASKVEKNDDAMIFLLSALGLTGDKARVVPVLESFLVKGGNVNLIHGAAYGLGKLGAAQTVPKMLSLIDEQYPRDFRESLLNSANEALGRPEDEARIVELAGSPNPLRLWAVDRLRWFGVAIRTEPRSLAVRKAAASALSDKNPVIRHRAVVTVAAASRGYFTFLTDQDDLQLIASLKSDPSPLVRVGVIDALHETAMRRGLSCPGTTPLKLEGHTMRMLRWPSDWITFPLLISLIDDPVDEVREKAVWMLGITTGYWHGYEDIRLLGTPLITAQVKALYQEMWNAMKDKKPDALTVEILDDVIKRMEKGDGQEVHGQWFLGARLLTGRDFGWRADATDEIKAKAIRELAAWWATNRTKSPISWIMDTARAEGFKTVDDYNFYILARSGLGNPPFSLFDRKTRSENPSEILRNLEAWWNSASAKH